MEWAMCSGMFRLYVEPFSFTITQNCYMNQSVGDIKPFNLLCCALAHWHNMVEKED